MELNNSREIDIWFMAFNEGLMTQKEAVKEAIESFPYSEAESHQYVHGFDDAVRLVYRALGIEED